MLRSRWRRPLVSPDVGDAWLHGLYAAEVLKTHFPTHYATFVAAQRTTPQALLSCAEAFLYLAHDTLVHLDIGDEVLSIGETHPDALFAARLVSSPEALDRLSDELAASLRGPMPWYWGLDREVVVEDSFDEYILAKAILAVMHDTPWHWELNDGWWRDALPPAWAETIARFPRLPPDTDIDALLACLDRLVVWNTPYLGSVVRYIHSMTGNPYADYSRDEVMEMNASLSWEWSTDELRAEGVAQRQAMAIADRYEALERRIRADPTLLEKVIATLCALGTWETARVHALRGEPHPLPLFPEVLLDLTTIAGVQAPHGETLAASHTTPVSAGDSAAG